MITKEIEVDSKVYRRDISFKEQIDEKLRQQARDEAGKTEIDWSTEVITIVPGIIDTKCGCAKRSTIVLTVDTITNIYKTKSKIKQ